MNGIELWKSDGTDTGTVMVKDINANGSSDPNNIIAINDTLYFSGSDGIDGFELWKSDGTDVGTELIKDIYQSSFFKCSSKYVKREWGVIFLPLMMEI